jgi:murein L,D-transpeptidase YafK
MPKLSPILLRVFKEESELEVWKQTAVDRFELLKIYSDLPLWVSSIGPLIKPSSAT